MSILLQSRSEKSYERDETETMLGGRVEAARVTKRRRYGVRSDEL